MYVVEEMNLFNFWVCCRFFLSFFLYLYIYIYINIFGRVMEDRTVHLTDYGITSSLFSREFYFSAESTVKDLYKWMALETLDNFEFSTQSDVVRTHFIDSYMVSHIWLRTILIVRKETRCRHIDYSYRLTTRVLLYAPSHRQDNTYHGL